MDSHSSVGALADVQKASGDDVAGCAAVHEEQVAMVEAGVCEALGVIDLLIEADDGGDIVLAKVGEISLRGVKRVAWNKWERKGKEENEQFISTCSKNITYKFNSGVRLSRGHFFAGTEHHFL